jgi:hypothetical protein
MKKIFFLLAIILLSGISHGQDTENTLAGKARIKGGFGGPFFGYSQIENHTGFGGGGGGAFIINDFFLGGFGQGAAYGQHKVAGLNYDLSLGQGGFWLGYVWPSKRLVHGFGSFKFGFGKAMLNRHHHDGEPFGGNDLQDNVLVMTPELGVEINIAHWVRLAVTGGYRWVDGVDKLPYFKNTDFRSPVLGMTLRFGNFGYK